MWLVRVITLVLAILPFVVNGGQPLLLTLLFFPAIASAIGVAHQAADHEDEDDTDFVTPIFWRAAKESGWVLVVLAVLISRTPHMGVEDGFFGTLAILAPAAVFTLAGCHIGVLFIRDHMSREASAFGAGSITTAYLVVAGTGLYYLLYSPYADLVWPLPVAIILVAGVARIVARFSAGPVKIGSNWPLTAVSLGIVGWTILVFPLVHGVVQKKETSRLRVCERNLENISLALEMYAKDNEGQYPPNADEMADYLVPKYLKAMPTCPSSGQGYSFEVGEDAPSNEAGLKTYYFVYCKGLNHISADLPADYPRYSSDQGLTVR